MEIISCQHCGKLANMRKNARFCSTSCRVMFYQKKGQPTTQNDSKAYRDILQKYEELQERYGLLEGDAEYMAKKLLIYEPTIEGVNNSVIERYVTKWDLQRNAQAYIRGELVKKPKPEEIEAYRVQQSE